MGDTNDKAAPGRPIARWGGGDSESQVKRFWTIPAQVEDPRWAARRRLAAATRALVERCVITEGAPEELEAAAQAVEALVAGLAPGRRSLDAFRDGHYFTRPVEYTDRSALMGLSNPIAPPMLPTIDAATGESHCTLELGERFVGAPGMAHGGVVAACFDQICGHRVAMHGRGGFTIELELRYLRPVPVHRSVLFRAAIVAEGPDHLGLDASCEAEGRTLATAHAVFRLTDPEVARTLIRRLGD